MVRSKRHIFRPPNSKALRLAALICTVTAGGAIIIVLGATGHNRENLAALLTLAALGCLAERYATDLFGDSHVSVSVAAILTAGMLDGLWGIAVVVPAVCIAAHVGTGSLGYKTLYNIGCYTLAGGASFGVVEAFAVGVNTDDWLKLAVAVSFGATANFVVNSTLVALAIGVSKRQSPMAVWQEKYRWLLPHYLVMGVGAAVGASTHDRVGTWGVLAFAFPAIIIHHNIHGYVKRLAETIAKLTSLEAISDLQRRILSSISRGLDVYDYSHTSHRQHVLGLCRTIASRLGVSANSKEWVALEQAALLHDVSLADLPKDLFRKPHPLSQDEWALVRRHPDFGYRIFADLGDSPEVAEIILAHHERYDGTGYPFGLAGEAIPLGARILSVAEALAAMQAKRPYKSPLSREEALLELERNKGSQFDPAIVETCLAAL